MRTEFEGGHAYRQIIEIVRSREKGRTIYGVLPSARPHTHQPWTLDLFLVPISLWFVPDHAFVVIHAATRWPPVLHYGDTSNDMLFLQPYF